MLAPRAALLLLVVVVGVRRAAGAMHHKCALPSADSDAAKSHGVARQESEWCTACYMETMASLAELDGSDMVLGANDGISYDPAWSIGYWERSRHHTIVWVEPNPTLFKRLAANTAAIKNKVLMNAAVRPKSMEADSLTLYCWNTTMVDEVSSGRMASPLPQEAGQVKEFWNALCSMSKSDLLGASDIKHNLNDEKSTIPKALQSRMIEDIVRKHVIAHTVPALWPADLIAEAGITNVNYVQIDVEGMDNDIVQSLPLGEKIGESMFDPKLIMFENHAGKRIQPWLEDHGYYVCCCFNHNGNNIVAVKQ